MLIYEIQSIPDLTLSKYQVFADSGIEGMLEAQTDFIRQLHRVALLGNVSVHFVFDYDPSRMDGQKLNIKLIFSGLDDNDTYINKLSKIINSSSISQYFNMKEILPRGMARVPDVTNHTLKYSQKKLKSSKLQFIISSKDHSLDVPANSVLSQKVLPGTLVPEDSVVELIISGGDMSLLEDDVMANLTYLPKEKAADILKNYGITPTFTYRNDDSVAEGLVISQSTIEGTKIHPDTNVNLEISLGRSPNECPNLLGIVESKAREKLARLKIPCIVEYVKNDTAKKGRVYLQSIPAGNKICSDNKIVLTVNNVDSRKTCFSHMAVMRKKERFLQTVINNEERYFYVVPNWEISDDARLYGLLKMMQSFNEKCVYRVDLYTEDGISDRIHRNFEKPLTYLRNISNQERGISELSKIHRERRDPNADETLKQYEEWLKAIDTSPAFICRICALTNDSHYGQLLLDSTISESLETGDATILTKNGDFFVDSLMDEIPVYCSSDTPQSMQRWVTTFTVDEIAAFSRLPVLYDGEAIELRKETAAKIASSGMLIGHDTNDYPVMIPQDLLPKHMFVCGVPGSGKTNTMLHLAKSLWNTPVNDNGTMKKSKIPFLVLEPAKKEYRELALPAFDIPELIMFSPSACTNFPLKLNPFEFPLGLTLSEHIGNLCKVFEGAFPIAPPAPFILDRAIQKVYENKGWNYKDINTGVKEYPVLSELYSQFELELQNTKYDGEIRGNIQSVLEMRIGSLLRREMKEIFDVSKSTLVPEEWLQRPVIIELEALGEGPANFVTLLLCTLIRETLKADPLKDREKAIRHVIFIEEAHNLIAPESQTQDPQDSNPKIAATAFIVKMLAEVRALREGIIIADQLPTAMAPEVIKNTNIKLIHRLTSQDDRELVGSTMSASPLQMENMATYTSGQALITFEKLLRPFEMQVCEVEEHATDTPDDEKLLEFMMDKPEYKALLRKETALAAEEIDNFLFEMFGHEKNDCNALVNVDPSAMDEAKFGRWLEMHKDRIANYKKKSIELQLACEKLSDKLFDADEKERLLQGAKVLGKHYEEAFFKLIKQLY